VGIVELVVNHNRVGLCFLSPELPYLFLLCLIPAAQKMYISGKQMSFHTASDDFADTVHFSSDTATAPRVRRNCRGIIKVN